MKPDANKGRPTWVRFSGVGFELVGAMAGFALFGYWIDRHYGSGPWGLVVGAVLGIVGGLYNLIRTTIKAFDETGDDGEKGGTDGGH